MKNFSRKSFGLTVIFALAVLMFSTNQLQAQSDLSYSNTTKDLAESFRQFPTTVGIDSAAQTAEELIQEVRSERPTDTQSEIITGLRLYFLKEVSNQLIVKNQQPVIAIMMAYRSTLVHSELYQNASSIDIPKTVVDYYINKL